MTKLNKTEVIAALGLAGHFEGGYFRETFRPTHRKSWPPPAVRAVR